MLTAYPPRPAESKALHLKGELRCVFSGECYRVGRATQTLYSVRGEPLVGVTALPFVAG